MDSLLHSVVAGTISQTDYTDSIKKLAKFVKQENEKTFVLSIDFDRILKPFQESEMSLPKKLRSIEDFVEKQLKGKLVEPV